MKKVLTKCCIEGCEVMTKNIRKGMCPKHYERRRRYGTTELTANFGQTSHKLYKSWAQMHRRCERPQDHKYKLYGERGIKVCERWSGHKGFLNFIEDMGDRPDGCSLDRIDVDGDYCPENCRWADAKVQANNRQWNKQYGCTR